MSEASTASKWEARVGAWRASGTSASRFAEGKGFESSTLRRWEGKLRRGSKSPGPADVAMARVVRTSPGPAAEPRASDRSGNATAVAIDVNGVRIVVRCGFDPALLRQVVQALGAER